MEISKICELAHQNAADKGFYEDLELVVVNGYSKNMMNNAIATRLALIHSEVSEALEALRVNNYTEFQEELADIVIRVCDLAGYLKIDLDDKIEYKMEKNKNRKPKHGKEF